jgi:hypothetical protein
VLGSEGQVAADEAHSQGQARQVDLARASWRKSSWSAANGSCVEIAHLQHGEVGVRDTKDRGLGPVLIFADPEWDAFLSGVKHGDFDSI